MTKVAGRAGARPGFFREVGVSGLVVVASVIVLVAVVATVFVTTRPPTIEEFEEDIWRDWARLTTDSLGYTLVDQILENRQAAGQKLVETVGRLIEAQGEQFVVQTDVRYLRIRTPDGAIFAEWESPSNREQDASWKDLRIALTDREEGVVGTLEVGYKFYAGGLESLPNIRRVQQLYVSAIWLVGVLGFVTLIAILANLSRIRERAGRLQSQQVTLELAHQMCHELRNGLWAFSLEGKNLRQLFQMVETHLRSATAALEAAMDRIGLTPAQKDRVLTAYSRRLAEEGVDPNADVLPCAQMAKEAFQQIDSFSRYVNLTVEELDRNLLGAAGGWEPIEIRLSDAWKEACELLQMRFRSTGVEHIESIDENNDWVVADRRALVHVFINLAKNAIEALRDAPAPRRLEFAVRSVGGAIECVVRNGGTPIPRELLPLVFTRGFTTKPGAGRGTGLALVRQSVRRMNGTVAIDSNEKEGTRVRLTFPRRRAA